MKIPRKETFIFNSFCDALINSLFSHCHTTTNYGTICQRNRRVGVGVNVVWFQETKKLNSQRRRSESMIFQGGIPVAVPLSFVAFVLSLFVPHLSFLWCLGEIVAFPGYLYLFFFIYLSGSFNLFMPSASQKRDISKQCRPCGVWSGSSLFA